MSLFTQEHRETIERVRANHDYRQHHMDTTDADYGPAHDDCADLLAILDSLPEPKQYTEDELRDEFEKVTDNGAIYLQRDAAGRYDQPFVETWWRNWLECAKFLGALRE